MLRHRGGGRWGVARPSKDMTAPPTFQEGFEDLGWEDIRLSIQWKAYCWRDEAERTMAEEHTDDLDSAEAFSMSVESARGLEPSESTVG